MQPRLNPNLREFWQTKADIKILKGGRSSSKTWDTAGVAIILASRYCVKFLCVRQFQNRLEDSVYAILMVQIERFGMMNEFTTTKGSIIHNRTGSSFHFYGINRNLADIKGFEGADILWSEESEALTKDQWATIEPTVRKEGSEAWILYNPRFVDDFVESLSASQDGNVLVRHINYQENPFISKKQLRTIERLKESDYEQYEHDYLGVPYNDDDNVIIKRSWVEAAIDAHVKLGIEPSGKKRIGFDIADSGKDLCSISTFHGVVATGLESWKGKEDELLISCKRVWDAAIKSGAHVVYDSIGVGASAGAKFQELNEERLAQSKPGSVTYSKFIAGGGVFSPDSNYISTDSENVTNKEFFSNLKAQAWWNVSDRFRNTYNAVTRGETYNESELISISSEISGIQNLIQELCVVRRKFNSASKVCAESKDELAKRGIDSPNDADSFIMGAFVCEDASLNDFYNLFK